MAFGKSRSTRSLRSDLLVAADSVTSAMSSLVREFNSGDSDEDQSDHRLESITGMNMYRMTRSSEAKDLVSEESEANERHVE